jgi:methyltransferase
MLPMRSEAYAIVLFSFLILQRLLELVLAQRNRRWAMAHGGHECNGRTYPGIVAVHALFYVSLVFEWMFRSKGWNSVWPLLLVLIAAAQVLRFWSIWSLGRWWNTRIITAPGMELVLQGPYRFIRHPNYTVVSIELLAIPMLCGAYFTAAVFSLANALILAKRIPEEEQALEQATGGALPRLPRFVPWFPHKESTRIFRPKRIHPQENL